MAFKIKNLSFLFVLTFFNTFGEENSNLEDRDLLTKVTLENNRVSCGLEMTASGSSISNVNPFILDFEVYNSAKLKDQIFILGLIGKRDIISSFRKNNSYTDDSMKGFIWHKRFNLSAGYQKTELDIPIDPAVKREEINKSISLDLDFIDLANLEILSNIYVRNVESSNNDRKFYLAEGSITSTYLHNIFKKLKALNEIMSGYETSKIGISFYRGVLDNSVETKSIFSIFSENNFDITSKNILLSIIGKVDFDINNSDLAFDFTLNSDYRFKDNLIFRGKLSIDNTFVRYLDVLSKVEDRDVMAPLKLTREIDTFIDLGMEYEYGSRAKFLASADLHRTTDKIFFEIDKSIGGNPIKLSNYSGSLIYLNLNGEASYKIWKINLISKYKYSSLDKIAFNPLHTISIGGEFEHNYMILKVMCNYKNNFYCLRDKKEEEQGYWINNISFKYRVNSKANILCHIYNVLNNSGNYKKDFPIEKMKFKIEFECDF